ncbi:hypothetical protein [Paradesulfitobacterium ferrireducens]|uniref:hypothetical protein n=1 Tax=Paradesulfitobacterium ferrireducens TaxID=2816476 RepID=UPI001A8D0066|nr:hypothetical protein [Paradesulfitobacterium ferrireducens]
MLLILLVTTTPAFAESKSHPTYTDKQIAELKIKLTHEGVSELQQTSLINKLQKGIPLDSMDPVKLASVPEYFFQLDPNNPIKKYVFPDGSYIKNTMTVNKEIPITLENKQELIDAIGVDEANKLLMYSSNYTVSSEPYIYRNTWIQMDGTLSGGGFECAYALNPGGYGYIISVSDADEWSILGTCTGEELTIPTQYQSFYYYANARLTWQYIVYQGAAQFTCKVDFFINGGTSWATYSGV